MKLQVRDMDIQTGRTLVAILHKKDARKLDLHISDRIRVTNGRRSITAVLDIADSAKVIPPGNIGIFEELLKLLNAKDGDMVHVFMERKPDSVAYILQKLNGKKLKENEILSIITDLVNNNLSSIELTYFIAGCFVHDLDLDETASLTKAMINTGTVLKLNKYPIIDKHCIGGIPGNRTTMVVVPILLAAGYTVPKTSSRSITSPAGTADTMEILTNVSLNINQIKKVIKKVGGCMVWGGAVNLAPADDKIIAVENPLSIDAEGNLLASILAKKGSVSATHVLIDIPVGPTAKITSMKEALHLKNEFIKLGKKIGMKILVLITDGSQPIGNGIGPSLEARDVLYLLKNDPRAPKDLREKSLFVASELLYFINPKKSKKEYLKIATDIIDSGRAWKKMLAIINAQGRKITEPDKIPFAKLKFNFHASKSGVVHSIDNKTTSKIARLAGAPHDKSAGIYLYKHVGDKVKKGEVIFTIYSENEFKMKYAKKFLKLLDGFCIK